MSSSVECPKHTGYNRNQICLLCDEFICDMCKHQGGDHPHNGLPSNYQQIERLGETSLVPQVQKYITEVEQTRKELERERKAEFANMKERTRKHQENVEKNVLGKLRGGTEEILREYDLILGHTDQFEDQIKGEISSGSEEREREISELRSIEKGVREARGEAGRAKIMGEYSKFKVLRGEKGWMGVSDIDPQPHALDYKIYLEAIGNVKKMRDILYKILGNMDEVREIIDKHLSELNEEEENIYSEYKREVIRPYKQSHIYIIGASSPRFTEYNIQTGEELPLHFPKEVGTNQRIRLPFGADVLPTPQGLLISGGKHEEEYLGVTRLINIVKNPPKEVEVTARTLRGLRVPRCHHALVALDANTVIVIGGENAHYLGDCELFQGEWEETQGDEEIKVEVGGEEEIKVNVEGEGGMLEEIKEGDIIGELKEGDNIGEQAKAHKILAKTWEQLPELHHPRSFPGTCSFECRWIYTIGGFYNGQMVESIEKLDMNTRMQWDEIELKDPGEQFTWMWSYGCIQDTINTILVFGGTNGMEDSSKVFQFDVNLCSIKPLQTNLHTPDHFYRRKPLIYAQQVFVYGFNYSQKPYVIDCSV